MDHKRNIYLDYLRGISAIMVILYHYTTRYESLFQNTVQFHLKFPHGSYAFLVFFMLSGYFTLNALNNSQPYEYAIKRFFKLYPTYWVAICITMPLTVLFLPERSVSVKDMLVNFTMLQTLVGVPNVDGAYWTLFCELAFYILIFIMLLLKLNKRRAVTGIISLWIVSQL